MRRASPRQLETEYPDNTPASRHRRAPLLEAARRPRPAGALVLMAAVGLVLLDRLRQRRQPAAGARRRRGSGRWRSAPRSAPAAAAWCGSARPRALLLACSAAPAACCSPGWRSARSWRLRPTTCRALPRSRLDGARPRLHRRRLAPDRRRLRPRAGAAASRARPPGRAQGGRPHRRATAARAGCAALLVVAEVALALVLLVGAGAAPAAASRACSASTRASTPERLLTSARAAGERSTRGAADRDGRLLRRSARERLGRSPASRAVGAATGLPLGADEHFMVEAAPRGRPGAGADRDCRGAARLLRSAAA